MNSKTLATASSPEAVTVKPVSYITLLIKSAIALFALLALMAFVGTVEYYDDQYYFIPDPTFV